MNAGLMADLPSLPKCGALGVGLFRTELQFLIRTTVPKRAELAALYARILDAARDKPVVFRTLDIGSDKVLPYMKRADEPNPALGWRAIRVGLDRPRHDADAGAGADPRRPGPAAADHVPLRRRGQRVRGGPRARPATKWRASSALGHTVPASLKIGAMLETPSLAYRARPLLRARRLHLDRRQRPQAVLLRRRPRERAGPPPLRHAEPELPRLSRAGRRAAAPPAARRCRSAARMPGGRSRRWRWRRSASAACRCARRRSVRSSRSCARSTSSASAPRSTPPAAPACRAPARRSRTGCSGPASPTDRLPDRNPLPPRNEASA